MPELYIDRDRYGGIPKFPLVEAVVAGVQDVVRRKFAESGESWDNFVFGSSDMLITAEDLGEIETRIVASGYRFAWSSNLSLRDRPDIYANPEAEGDESVYSFEHPDAKTGEPDSNGRALCGTGDNVVERPANFTGTALYIRTSEKVLELMRDGVPPGTIAIIDDSGGTLTAPILEHCAGVICAGGTVRSHLGILTREYGIPCLMNAKISGVRNGDTVEIETSAPARTIESYQTGHEMSANIWTIA